MYNFSGIWFRIWGVCGIVLLVGVLCVVLEKPWIKGFKLKKCKLGLGIIAFAICMSLLYGTRILFPDVSSYAGTFVSTNRNSRVAPPLPVTYEYVFWDGNGQKKVFYLDFFQKRKYIHLTLRQTRNIP